jgi:probable HAF family extracellular repeat protein
MSSKTRHFTWATIIVAIVVATAPMQAQTSHANQPSKYYVFNLGAPLGGVPEPVGINDLGWISGGANLVSNTQVHAELWVGAPLDIGTLGGPNSNIAWPNHSNRGEIVGISETAEKDPLNEAWSCSAFFFGPDGYVCRGFTWKNGKMTKLPTLGGINGYAAGVNNAGQVVGWSETSFHDPTCVAGTEVLQFLATLWAPETNQPTELPPLSPDPDSAATAINDRGQVVGISGLCSVAVGGASAEHALLWENGVPHDLGNIGGQAWNTPVAINNRGVIVGFANTSGDEHAALAPTAFIWTRSAGMKPILPYGSDTNNIAFDLNDRNQVVGQSANGNTGAARAFLWQNDVASDLNTLVIGPTSLNLVLAQGINDAGEITGTAVDTSTGEAVGFLAVPAFTGSDAASTASAAATAASPREVVVSDRICKQLPYFSRAMFDAFGK